MLAYLARQASERKQRLFSAACCRRIWHLYRAPNLRRAVEAVEQHVDGLIGYAQLQQAISAAARSTAFGGYSTDARVHQALPAGVHAAWAAVYTYAIGPNPQGAAQQAAFALYASLHGPPRGGKAKPDPGETRAQAELVRCVFGNPFRPPPAPGAWLAWQDGLIPNMARAIYEERAFDQLPVLGDALEEAGCADETILAHCRGPGPHARGCWVVDLLRAPASGEA
jgi:hypothetical protein